MNLDKTPVKIGFLYSRTGVTSVVESQQREAAILAVEEINQDGGLLGEELLFSGCDTRSNPAAFRAEGARLLSEERVDALFGCYMSSCRKAVLQTVNDHKSTLFYPTHYEGFEYAKGCIYSGATPNQSAKWLADFMTQTYGGRFFFVGSNYIFPYEINRLMRDLLSNRGADVVDEVYIPLGSSGDEIDCVINRIKQSQPVIVFSTLVGTDAVDFYRAYDNAGFDRTIMPICSVTAGEPEMAAMGRSAAEGNIKAAPYFSVIDSDVNRRFVTRFRERFGEEASLCAEAEAAYFQIKLFAEAVRQAGGTDRDDLLRVLPTFSLEAPQGLVRVDAATNHTVLWPRVAIVDADGKFRIVREASSPVIPSPYLIQLEDPVALSHAAFAKSSLS
ncbi:aliphatic amidase expression-regulating protein [Roseovarius mucosus]|uniref:Aliphatic amidase expression-regulating protein n=1 Tax=Roseovarius mucosus TaxID=215743 RepID=A0A1V0RLW2_9RHOB|nr:transporter substrate-binding domain-containing protein [Roseovarius mucosus]ARE82655.1 aliphatic amidase expression-regulating protein [Roseovarius mucosus]